METRNVRVDVQPIRFHSVENVSLGPQPFRWSVERPSGKADWLSILKQVLPFVNIFLPSIEEIAYMLDRDLFEARKAQANGGDPVLCYSPRDCSAITGKLLEMGVNVAAIKMGINGYYIRTADAKTLQPLDAISGRLEEWSNREIWAPSYKAERFGSATGAGDATIAGFLTAVLHGLGPVEAAKAANLLGWQNVREVDALSGIQDWPATLEMIRDDQKPRNSLTIDETGWQFSKDKQVYFGPNDQRA